MKKNSKLISKIYHLRSKASFTLIETIVVIAVIGLVIPAVFSIIFVILREQVKITRLQQVKKEGDIVKAKIEATVKNNITGIYSEQLLTTEQCAQKDSSYNDVTPNEIYFKDKNGKWFNYVISGGKVIYQADGVSNQELTSDKVIVSRISDKFLLCDRGGLYSTANVIVWMYICYKDPASGTCLSGRPEEDTSLNYQYRIKLKNY